MRVADGKSRNKVTELLTRLVRVPKKEIDEQDEKYRKKRAADEYRGQRRPVVPALKRQKADSR
jgi:hypothetical protein